MRCTGIRSMRLFTQSARIVKEKWRCDLKRLFRCMKDRHKCGIKYGYTRVSTGRPEFRRGDLDKGRHQIAKVPGWFPHRGRSDVGRSAGSTAASAKAFG